jgi:hypothetical protein
MNYQMFALTMCSVVGCLGYLLTNVHLKEATALRIHCGLRNYLQRAQQLPPEMC